MTEDIIKAGEWSRRVTGLSGAPDRLESTMLVGIWDKATKNYPGHNKYFQYSEYATCVLAYKNINGLLAKIEEQEKEIEQLYKVLRRVDKL